MPRSRRLLVATSVWIALGLAASDLAAASASGTRDPARDASSYQFDPEPQPCGTLTTTRVRRERSTDITRLDVRHTQDGVLVDVHVRDLLAGTHQSTSVFLETEKKVYEASISVLLGSRDTTVDLTLVPPLPTFTPADVGECGIVQVVSVVHTVTCPGLRAAYLPAADQVSFTVPRSCLRSPRWVRAGATTSRLRGNIAVSDTWAPRGTDDTAYPVPFGRKVRVGEER